MGEHRISQDQKDYQAFMTALLADLKALEQMLESNLIETGLQRIGAEQEMFLIDGERRPAPVAQEVLKKLNDPRFTTEIGRFNLEANLTPQLLDGPSLGRIEKELTELIESASWAANTCDADVLLTGILPTLRQSDLTLKNLTPISRYEELNRSLNRLRGNSFNVHIKGVDELHLSHDNVMLEAACTSFQVHLQVAPRDFPRLYNLAQAITAPLMAVAANSPLLLGHRLWHETRIALFQHSVDERSSTRQLRNHPPRVSFGGGWIDQSVLEIFYEDVSRFRVILTMDIEDSLVLLARGELPKLTALRLHNGTVWRWNRPCYGVIDGKAHLRIENRVLPSGPSVADEMANLAFFVGLMSALPEEYGAIERKMTFDEAKENFFSAARHGLKAPITWLGMHSQTSASLILGHLLPLAREGLRYARVDGGDRLLGIIEERVRREQNGSLWALRSFASMSDQVTKEQRSQALVEATLANQKSGQPVHLWPVVTENETTDLSRGFRTVEQIMSTDLFTVRPDDLVDLSAGIMYRKHIRHVPVEDDSGHLIGLVSHRDLLRLLAQGPSGRKSQTITVREIMKIDPLTVSRSTPTIEALALMRQHKVGCLPVTENGCLVGIVTAYDFLALSTSLLEKCLKTDGVREAREEVLIMQVSEG